MPLLFKDLSTAAFLEDETGLEFKKPPAEGHRCGICPTYFQKLCAFDFHSNDTFIFDNLCLMDLYNCIHGTEFIKLNYENCLYFGNFAYVHGLKHEDYDYGEDHITMTHSKKNPDFSCNVPYTEGNNSFKYRPYSIPLERIKVARSQLWYHLETGRNFFGCFTFKYNILPGFYKRTNVPH